MNMNRSLHVAAIALLLALLPACGFHLRGDVELPPALQETYLESRNPYTGMARALRVELEAAGGRIVESSENASAVLHIVREISENRILSVGSTGKASEYELFNEVVFSLIDAEGKVLIKPQSLRMTRDLVFDETELLGKISEAEGIHRQMRRNLARQIIIRIGVGLRQQ
ncbi:MAG: LPS assembly lipoprotein LptE [Thiogranum sp.]